MDKHSNKDVKMLLPRFSKHEVEGLPWNVRKKTDPSWTQIFMMLDKNHLTCIVLIRLFIHFIIH